ncbi:unnamed protein product, partial [Rotaria sordida]
VTIQPSTSLSPDTQV